jgi:hypothetical protein
MPESRHSADNDALSPGDVFTWVHNPGSLVEVLSVGRKYAQIRVTQATGASWLKKQPMPFPPAFMRLSTRPTPPEETP